MRPLRVSSFASLEIIYDFTLLQVKIKLKGHQKKITGLAFSQSLNVLVSSGADAQVCDKKTEFIIDHILDRHIF